MRVLSNARHADVIANELAEEPVEERVARAGAHEHLRPERTPEVRGGGEPGVVQAVARRVVPLQEGDVHEAVVRGRRDPREELVGRGEVAVHDKRGLPGQAAVHRAAEAHVRVTRAIVAPHYVQIPARAAGDRGERVYAPTGVLEGA